MFLCTGLIIFLDCRYRERTSFVVMQFDALRVVREERVSRLMINGVYLDDLCVVHKPDMMFERTGLR